ncbi:hypothetical protein B0J14DRAFT_263927 [Halenospora varia]|nr:hypothetical protein B0J14DRAFT_263927 [Halenospora varia]
MALLTGHRCLPCGYCADRNSGDLIMTGRSASMLHRHHRAGGWSLMFLKANLPAIIQRLSYFDDSVRVRLFCAPKLCPQKVGTTTAPQNTGFVRRSVAASLDPCLSKPFTATLQHRCRQHGRYPSWIDFSGLEFQAWLRWEMISGLLGAVLVEWCSQVLDNRFAAQHIRRCLWGHSNANGALIYNIKGIIARGTIALNGPAEA